MGFIDTYKHLEKLCSEIMDDDRGVTAYINEMDASSDGRYYVQNWEHDFKNLKHYRWIRNQIAHEPGCNESNMCDPEDELWLRHFYFRIMKQTDPLSMYRKAHSAPKTPKEKEYYDEDESYPYVQKRKRSYIKCFFVISLLIIILWLLYQYLHI